MKLENPRMQAHRALAHNHVDAIEQALHRDSLVLDGVPLPKSGGTAVDVGANVGLYAIHIAPRFGRVLAIEPDPEHVLTLKANVAEAGLAHKIRIVEAAVTPTDGPVTFFFNGDNPTTSSLVRRGPLAVASQVDGRSLTTLLAGIPHVDFLKLDCEGAEMELLAPGAFTAELAQKISTIWVEVHTFNGLDYPVNRQRLTDDLAALGYHSYRWIGVDGLLVSRLALPT